MVGIKNIEYGKKQVASCSDAIATAVKLCEPKVIALYPDSEAAAMAQEKLGEL